MIVYLPDEEATLAFAARLQTTLPPGYVVFLHGNLGAGKTTLVRGYLRAAGYQGTVKSPTYTLVEEYALADRTVYHFDLYRLNDPEELEWMGIRDYFRPDSLCFVEWPEKGEGFLPPPDLEIDLEPENTGRRLRISPNPCSEHASPA
ncbi:tRNA (adenosine(37)-N6)-threonylcarbamoyltransferase complex ATPase subunit type 1 TsaE [Methylococcus mesophilus]|uniref:tRNA (adenosine(37)-N6)-threonylcarbamoyltransferase complex ATPase subunit type 1 TsaE n=1 Tax=Methylococcus mesophilus TaxID=2993564 RepID=UPI00224ABF7A|nr:tRNA (adenosine(37)-N6)-threonylcarbamoyltransferase complex ATPase subunit type 1 TsaE [Methylococcus mesophilus]UZR29684.1 tRNA (adenosine(37)-N6)-threonylcarbamoyltransferase complex ATPase subunit type 1 TsaE [Methylococcus mesophilus]